MSRLVTVTVRSLCLFFGLAGLTAAQDPPPLEPPSLEPPRVDTSQTSPPESSPKPASPKPAASTAPSNPARAATVRPEARPMLAIPGVTAPPPRPPSAVRPQAARPVQARTSPFPHPPEALPSQSGYSPARSPSGIGWLPAHRAPLAAIARCPAVSSRSLHSGTVADRGHARERADTASRPTGETIPLTIEPLDGETTTERAPTGRPSVARPLNGRTAGATSTARPDDEPVDPRPTPRRGTGILGRLFGPPPPAPRPPSREAARTESKSRDEIRLRSRP